MLPLWSWCHSTLPLAWICFGSQPGCQRMPSITLGSLFTPFISTIGSTFGACVGLFFLAIFYRFVAAVRAITTACNRAGIALSAKDLNELNKLGKQSPAAIRLHYPGFYLKLDLTSGVLEGLFSFVGYLLMLAVNSFRPYLAKKTDSCWFVGYGDECLVFCCNPPGHHRWWNIVWTV